MVVAVLEIFLTIWAVFAMIIGGIGFLLMSYQWLAAELFGRPVKVDGIAAPIDRKARIYLASGLVPFGIVAAAGAWIYSNLWVAERLVGSLPEIPLWIAELLAPAFWLGLTAFLGAMAGWPSLQRSFPKPHGGILARQRLGWALMGRGVVFKNVLRISAYRHGVGIEMNRFFGVFSRPVIVPWEEVFPCPIDQGTSRLVKVRLGEPERTSIVLTEDCWSRIELHRPEA
jgi:hypothetical protein